MPEDESKETKEKEIIKEILSWIRVIVIAVVLAVVINSFVIINAKVDSGSMENTMMTDSRAFGFRFAYWFSEPERYDIIVFIFPDDPNQKEKFVKRIIGLPGETVEITDGIVSVIKTDGTTETLDDSFLKEAPEPMDGTYVVPENSYFVMGDNRNDSRDSRMWTNKFVPEDKILGKVVLNYWPEVKILK